jgi:hypothetical protein
MPPILPPLIFYTIYKPLGSALQYSPLYHPTRSRLGLNQGNLEAKRLVLL